MTAQAAADVAWEWLEKARASYRGGAEVHLLNDGTALVRSEHLEATCGDSDAAIGATIVKLHAKEIGRKARKLMERALR